MESIQDHLENLMNKSDIGEKYKKIMREQVFTDQDVRRFIAENKEQLDTRAIEKSSSKLYEFVSEKRKFNNGEPGLMPGYYPRLLVNNNRIELEYVPSKQEIKKQNEAAIQRRIQSFYMPKNISEASFDDLEMSKSRVEAVTKSLNFAEQYTMEPKQFHKGLYLHGAFGVGKTYLLGALAKELSENGFQTTLVHFPTLAVEMKNSIGNNTTQEKMDTFKNAEILMLDDIGADSMSSWIRDDVLGVILQHRMQEQLSTFFTSNLSMDQLEKEHLSTTQRGEYEPLKASRIMERIRYLSEEIEMTGKNRRNI